MSKVFISFWEFLWKNLSVIKVCGLIFIFVYTTVNLFFVWGSIVSFFTSEYVPWIVQENIPRTYTCWRAYTGYSCTKFSTIISYIDKAGNTRAFQSGLIENQKIWKNFTVVYNTDHENTLVESLLILWFHVFILFTVMPVYLMVYHAYKKEITPFREWKTPLYKKIYKGWMMFWFLFVWICVFFWWSLWSYFVWEPLISIGSFILWIYVLYNMFKSFRKI